MLAKSRKSSFNDNIRWNAEFCSLIISSIIIIIIIYYFFYGALDYLDIFRIQAYAKAFGICHKVR